MEIQAANPYLRNLRKLFRRKVKLMPPAEADEWERKLRDFCQSEYGLDFHPLQSDEAVVPPASVIDNVQGPSKSDPTTFFGTGYRETWRYLTELKEYDVDVSKMDRMLDMGFGTGRILLHFLPFSLERYGCDVNPAAYEWTVKTLGEHTHLSVSQLEPPLDYPDDFFDLIIATSVFTHTPYERQPGWIAEFSRILRPGGVSVVTVHDPAKTPVEARDRGWYETGTKKGIHMRTFLTEDKISELWGASLDYLGLRKYPPTQAHVIARKP